MNTASSTLNASDGFLIRRWGLWDLGFGLLAALGAAFATQRYASFMDIYELVILWCCVPAAVLLGYFWAALRPFFYWMCGGFDSCSGNVWRCCSGRGK